MGIMIRINHFKIDTSRSLVIYRSTLVRLGLVLVLVVVYEFVKLFY